ncbi:hypothetical protein D3C85_1360370 [compost metagenome]
MILSGKPGELFANLAFKTSVSRAIIARLCHFLREIFLPGGIGVRLIVGVAILLAIAHFFHQFGRGITQVNRHVIVRTIARIGHRGFKRCVDGITLRRAGQIDNRLSNSALTF